VSSKTTYKKHAAHHVHGGAEGGVHEALVGGDHPLAAGLVTRQHSVLLPLLFQADFFHTGCHPSPVRPANHVLLFPAYPTTSSRTHLLPGPQAILLLEVRLVLRDVVLTVDPAGVRQYRA
jgi:hypothetical protein